MPRKYKKVFKRQVWSAENLKSAIHAILQGEKYPKVIEQYGIPRETLRRKVIEFQESEQKDSFIYKQGLGFKSIYSVEQEQYLVDQIISHEARLLGFTPLEVRGMAYNLAKDLNLPNNFNDETQLAGLDWFRGFLKRHPILSLRVPEPTSAARASGFNKAAVLEFFKLLETVYQQYKFEPQNIYNVDETGVSCNPKNHSKIVAVRGKKQIGTKVSAERGTNVTACVCFSASGKYMGPMLIYPRKIVNNSYLEGAPPDASAEFNQSGWMEEVIFTKWLQRFIEFSKATKETPVLLLLDGHATHVKNLSAIKLAQDNGVVMLCFPPHTTHRLQPLDVSYMKPLSNYYSAAVNRWMRNHPKSTIALKDIYSIFGEAFLKASTMATAVNGFRKTGIYPFDPEIFKDEDFAAANAAGTSQSESSGVNEPTGVQNVNSICTTQEVANNLIVPDSVLPLERTQQFPSTSTDVSKMACLHSSNTMQADENEQTSMQNLPCTSNGHGQPHEQDLASTPHEYDQPNIQDSAPTCNGHDQSCIQDLDSTGTCNEVEDLEPALVKLKKKVMNLFEKSLDKILKSQIINNSLTVKKTQAAKKSVRAKGKAAVITDTVYASELEAAKANTTKRKSSVSTSVPRKKRKALIDLTNQILPSNIPMQQPNEGDIVITIPAAQGSEEMFVPVLQRPIHSLVQPMQLETLPQSDCIQYLYVP